VQAARKPQSKVQVQNATERLLWFPPPISQSQREKKQEKKEKDSASKTTAKSSTASETGATSKRVRLNNSARVCNGVDPEEREIVARTMKWPSIRGTTQHNLSKEKAKPVLDKMVVLCGLINSKIVSNGKFEWKAQTDSQRAPSKPGKTSNT